MSNEREPFEIAYTCAVENGWDNPKELARYIWDQAGAEWQRTQAQSVPAGYVLVPINLIERLNEYTYPYKEAEVRAILAAAPKADVQEWDGKSLPYDWVAVRMEFAGPDYPEDYAYGPPRMMNRLRGILERYYEQRFAAAPQPSDDVAKDALVEGLETIALESTDEQARCCAHHYLATYRAAQEKK